MQQRVVQSQAKFCLQMNLRVEPRTSWSILLNTMKSINSDHILLHADVCKNKYIMILVKMLV